MFLLVVLATLVLASSGIQSGKASDFYVRQLPGFISGTRFPEMHAGLIEVGYRMGHPNSSLFFWHMRAAKPTNYTVVWFNGGPGCSSMDGALFEIGPFRFGDDGTLTTNDPGNWLEFANLLFIDQPFGTGYSDPSETAWITTLEQAGEAVSLFLAEYTQIFPEFSDTNIILAGESFAGQYVPHIWKSLKTKKDAQGVFAKVAGIALINPWLNPAIQYLSYPQFIKDHHLVPNKYFNQIDSLQEQCMARLQKDGVNGFSVQQCEEIVKFVEIHSRENVHECVNIYDISKTAKMPGCGLEWPVAVNFAAKWLDRNDVRRALHAPEKHDEEPWKECSHDVSVHLKSGQLAYKFVAEILDHIPLLLMVGGNDFICNSLGIKRLVDQLEWSGSIGYFGQPETTSWGDWQSERNLSIANVANASHMVPYDHLLETQLVMKTWLGDKNFGDDLDYCKGMDNCYKNGTITNINHEHPKVAKEEIDKAMYRAYKQAGVVALVVVLFVVLILGFIWWKRGQGMSSKGFFSALLHFNISKTTTKRRKDYIPLRTMRRRPSVILEEDESSELDV